jgi:predicted permease
VRLALGAARGRLVAQLLTESLVLATLGGLAALLVAAWGGNLLRSVFFGDVLWSDALLDARVMWFAASATVLTAALSGLVPALQASAPNLAATLKAGAREGGGQRSRTRASLLVVQSTLAAILLVGTGLFVRSLRNVHAVPTGMRPDRVLMSSVALRGSEYSRSEVDALYARMAERALSVPGVASVAVSLTVPFASSWGSRIVVPGRDSVPGAYVNAVSPGYFETMGTRLLAGRDFTPVDDAAAPTIVISARAARRWWPDGDAVGRCVHLNADSLPCLQVIGIAEDVRKETVLEAEDDVLQVYVPLGRATTNMSQRILLVRAGTPDVASLMEPLRRAVQVAAVNLPYVDVRPMAQLLDDELRPWRLGASMFGAFGMIAALLTCLGIYGVVSYTAAQRTHEMGVRMALGARAPDVLLAVAGDGMHVSLRGAALGVVLALLLQGLVEPLLFGVSAFDPVVLGGVAGLLALVAALGSVVPAWRATRVDPVLALRSE